MWAALAITLTTLAAPAAASTDAAVCKAPRASPGQAIRGPILHIPSAELLCVAMGRDPSKWVLVPLAAPAPSRSRLMSAAFGENATCTIDAVGRADCSIEGAPLAQRLQRTPTRVALEWR